MGQIVPVAVMELSSEDNTNRGHTMARKVNMICDFDGIDHCVCGLLRLPYCDLDGVYRGLTASMIKVKRGRNACMKY